MSDTLYIILWILNLIITLTSTLTVIKVKLDNLSQKVEKHNNVIERTYKLEEKVENLDVKVNTQNKLIMKHIVKIHK